MIAETGLAALWLAAALSLLQLFFSFSILPASAARGEGDHPEGGGGVEGSVIAGSHENPLNPRQRRPPPQSHDQPLPAIHHR